MFLFECVDMWLRDRISEYFLIDLRNGGWCVWFDYRIMSIEWNGKYKSKKKYCECLRKIFIVWKKRLI